MAAVGDKAAPPLVPPSPPSLLSLCLGSAAAQLNAGDAGAGRAGGHRSDVVAEEGDGDLLLVPEEVAEALPWELLHRLASLLSPSALESLHHAAHARCCSSAATAVGIEGLDGKRRGVKRSRCDDFNPAWQALFRRRWPLSDDAGHDCSVTEDWQQKYWEKHLQECLDEAAESALLPSFCGSIDELSISTKITGSIYYSMDIPQQYSRLSYHWSRFGCYVSETAKRALHCRNLYDRSLTAGNPFFQCLLQQSKLETLMFIRVISELEVNGVCMLLSCHAETLLSLEFIYCQLYPSAMDKICKSVCQKGSLNHGIQKFSIRSSRISETNPQIISAGLLNFLSWGKYLHLLSLNDTKMKPSFAKLIFRTLLEAKSGIQTLEISENNISGWLKTMGENAACLSSALESNISLKSLTHLNLRGSNMHQGDIDDLCQLLLKMPNLRDLDISDNQIFEGIRSLVPFISWSLQKEKPLSRLRADNCALNSIGVTELLRCLSSVNKPIDMLSIAENHLGSSVSAALAKLLGSIIRELNVEDIGLGPPGFQILEEALPAELALTHINVSKNRGGIRAAHFVSKLILQAPALVSVNAGSNLLPPESLEIICNALKQKTCHLERVDLMGNIHLSDAIFPASLEFMKHGKQIVIVPSQAGASVPYDDDP